MAGRAALLACVVVWGVGSAGCASILGIEEQTLDSADAGDDGRASDAAADTTTGEDGASIDSSAFTDSSPLMDSSTAMDSSRPNDGAGEDGPPTCTSGARACAGPQPTMCIGGAWQNSGAPCSGTTLCVDGACADPPPSCAQPGPGTTSCGAGNESCCVHLPVQGGDYDRTYANPGSGPTATSDPATVNSFRLDAYEVTVGRFRTFVAAWDAGYAPPAGSGKHSHLNQGMGLVDPVTGQPETGWLASDDANLDPSDDNLDSCVSSGDAYSTWTPFPGNGESLPINCVNWYEAYAFCIWDQGFLPSEAEWEYASAGGSLELEYPWGATAPGTANQYAIYGCNYPDGSGICTGVANIAPVGTAGLGAGLWGQLDLSGNVLEWNLDAYASYADPCSDCAYLTPGSNRVTRGGGAGYDLASLLPPARNSSDPASRNSAVGLRCARMP